MFIILQQLGRVAGREDAPFSWSLSTSLSLSRSLTRSPFFLSFFFSFAVAKIVVLLVDYIAVSPSGLD